MLDRLSTIPYAGSSSKCDESLPDCTNREAASTPIPAPPRSSCDPRQLSFKTLATEREVAAMNRAIKAADPRLEYGAVPG